MEDNEKKLIEITSKYFQKKPEELSLETRLVEDLGIDSFGMFELTHEIQQNLQVQIEDSKLKEIKTVGDMLKILNEGDRNIEK